MLRHALRGPANRRYQPSAGVQPRHRLREGISPHAMGMPIVAVRSIVVSIRFASEARIRQEAQRAVQHAHRGMNTAKDSGIATVHREAVFCWGCSHNRLQHLPSHQASASSFTELVPVHRE
jgi:hypothetical protein